MPAVSQSASASLRGLQSRLTAVRTLYRAVGSQALDRHSLHPTRPSATAAFLYLSKRRVSRRDFDCKFAISPRA